MATASVRMTPEPSADSSPIPPLEQGDRLTRIEFERRYAAMPNLKKAELIEGVVHMPSPVRFAGHGQPHWRINTWLGVYATATPGVMGADNTTARMDLDNEPQPDVLLMIDPAKGGQTRISDDDFVEGAPELVVEIASSSVSYDLHAKLNVYRRNGMREYVVWRVLDRQIDWLVLRDGVYVVMSLGENGVYRSQVFSGLWLDPAAMLRGDMAAVLEALKLGLASAEHAAFVEQLRGR